MAEDELAEYADRLMERLVPEPELRDLIRDVVAAGHAEIAAIDAWCGAQVEAARKALNDG